MLAGWTISLCLVLFCRIVLSGVDCAAGWRDVGTPDEINQEVDSKDDAMHVEVSEYTGRPTL